MSEEQEHTDRFLAALKLAANTPVKPMDIQHTILSKNEPNHFGSIPKNASKLVIVDCELEDCNLTEVLVKFYHSSNITEGRIFPISISEGDNFEEKFIQIKNKLFDSYLLYIRDSSIDATTGKISLFYKFN